MRSHWLFEIIDPASLISDDSAGECAGCSGFVEACSRVCGCCRHKEYDFSKSKRGPVVKPKGKTLINDALRGTLNSGQRPVDAKTLRRILREELQKAG